MKHLLAVFALLFLLFPISQTLAQVTDTQSTLGVELTNTAPFIYKDSEGYTVVIGEVENTKSFPVNNVKVWVGFFSGDAAGSAGESPLETNGTERVVVSQLVRSPGVYFSRELDKTSDKEIFIAKIIPSRGAWLEFDVDKKETVGVRLDRKRRQLVTVLLKALGWTTDEILTLFDNAPSIQNTLEKDHVETQEEALEDIYRKLRPGEPPTAESAKTLLENLFFNPKRYDVARVGRHKVDKKLGKAEGVLLKQLRAHHKALGEIDNPDKKAWEQFKYRVFSDQGRTRA